MSILSNWFKQESTKVIFKAAVTILKTLAFGVGERLWSVVKREVESVDKLPISGQEKAKRVWVILEDEFKGLPGYIGNLAIELAVAYIKETKVKR